MDDSTAFRTKIGVKAALAGPQAASRRRTLRAANAATHGLTATEYLPEILGPELLERHRQSFHAEWQPSTATQAHLVEELARHAAALERATPIEEAVLRTSARGLSLMSHAPEDGLAEQDRVLAAACGSEAVDRVTRYRRMHEKAFLAALARLRELQSLRETVPFPVAASPILLRFDEATCLRYLQHRRDAEKSGCRSCGSSEGKWLVGHDRWQCRQCRRQASARSGTVMERSSLSLGVWFAAMGAILQDRQISTAALREITGIRREKTVRALAERIRQALDSADAVRLLAGLDLQSLRELARSDC
jgi:transposase-like protein